MMPKFGMLTNPLIDILKEIKYANKCGFNFIEIGIEGPSGMPEILHKKRRKILTSLEKHNLFAIAHTPWWIDLGSPYEDVRKGWVNESKKAIKVASELNVNLINFHSHSQGMFIYDKKFRKIILNNFSSSLIELVRYGKKYNVKIMLENAAGNKEITQFKDFKYIIGKSGVGVHLDVGHAFIHGGLKNIENYVKTFNDKIWHVHMSDNYGEDDDHLSIGQGTINYEKVVKMLKRINYDRTITLEVFTKNRNLIKVSLNKLKRIWRKN